MYLHHKSFILLPKFCFRTC